MADPPGLNLLFLDIADPGQDLELPFRNWPSLFPAYKPAAIWPMRVITGRGCFLMLEIISKPRVAPEISTSFHSATNLGRNGAGNKRTETAEWEQVGQ
jgi:hypothetical protein